MPSYDQAYWARMKRGMKADGRYTFEISVPHFNDGLPFVCDIDEEKLLYYQVDYQQRRVSNKPLPILYSIDIETGEFRYSLVSEDGARDFRRRKAYRDETTGERTGNALEATGDDEDDEAETSTEQEGETSEAPTGEELASTAPSELADGHESDDADAQPMDVDGGAFVSSSATVKAHSSSTPARAGPSSANVRPSSSSAPANTMTWDGSDSDLSSLPDESSPEKAPAPLSSYPLTKIKLPKPKPKRSPSPAAPPLRQSGAVAAPTAMLPPPPPPAARPFAPDDDDETDEDDDVPSAKRKAAAATSDVEDYKPDAFRADRKPTTKKQRVVSDSDDGRPSDGGAKPSAAKDAPARDRPSAGKGKEKAAVGGKEKAKGSSKGKERARERDEPEAGPSKPVKAPRVNREIKSTAMPSAPRPVVAPKPFAPSAAEKPSKDGGPPKLPVKLRKHKDKDDAPAKSSSSTAPSGSTKVVLKTSQATPSDGGTSSKPAAAVDRVKQEEPKSSSTPAAKALKASTSSAEKPSKATPVPAEKSSSKLAASSSSEKPFKVAATSSVDRAPKSVPTSAGASPKPAPGPRKELPSSPLLPPAAEKAHAPAEKSKLSSSTTSSSPVVGKDAPAAPASSPPADKAASAPAKKSKLATSTSFSALGKDQPFVASSPAPAAPASAVAAVAAAAPPKAVPSSASAPVSKPPSAKPSPPTAPPPQKKKPETLVKKAVVGNSGTSTPSAGTPSARKPKPAASTTSSSNDIVTQMLGGPIDSSSAPSGSRNASSIKVALSVKQQEELEELRREHAAEMAEFLASDGMTKPFDMEDQGHIIRARHNAIQQEASKSQAEVKRYRDLSEREQAAYGPPPKPYHPSHPHETQTLCARLLAAAYEDPELFEGDGKLAVPRNKAEAANGDFVWVEEMEGKWDDPAAVAAHLANPKYFPAK